MQDGRERGQRRAAGALRRRWRRRIGGRGLERVRQRARRGEPLLGILRHRAGDHGVDGGCAHARRRLGDVGDERGGVGLACVRHRARQAFEQDRAERVEVAAGRGRVAVDLLRRDVVERADELTRAGQAGLAERQREAEVRQVRVVARADEDVLRLEVAVDEPGLVRGDDVRVVERGLAARLTPDALLEALVARALRRDHLQRHAPVQRELDGLVDDAHPAVADKRLDPIVAELRSGFQHWARRRV